MQASPRARLSPFPPLGTPATHLPQDLGILFAILNHSRFCLLRTLFLVWEQVTKKSILLAYFRDLGKRNFYIRDLLFFLFMVRAKDSPHPPQTLYGPSQYVTQLSRWRKYCFFFQGITKGKGLIVQQKESFASFFSCFKTSSDANISY